MHIIACFSFVFRKLALVGIIPNLIPFSFSSDKDRRQLFYIFEGAERSREDNLILLFCFLFSSNWWSLGRGDDVDARSPRPGIDDCSIDVIIEMARNVESGLGGQKRALDCWQPAWIAWKIVVLVQSSELSLALHHESGLFQSPSSLALASAELKDFFFLTK